MSRRLAPMGLKRELLNKALKRDGFVGLEEPRALFNQISIFIHDHEDFRHLLMACEEQHRRACYDAMAPRLMFQAKAFEDYMMEQNNLDSAKYSRSALAQERFGAFPTLDGTVERMIEASADSHGTLTLTCAKCTRFEEFEGETLAAATIKARKTGWVYDPVNERNICPKCPAPREKTN